MFGTYRLRKKIERRVLGLSGHPARLLRSLITGRKPWKQNMIDISRPEGIGDILMCTPALREIKLLNPGIRIRFYTDLPQLVTGLPYIDEVLPMKEAPSTSISLKYEDAIPSFQHLARIMGDCIGIRVRDVTPDVIVQKKLADHYRNEWGVGKNHCCIDERKQIHSQQRLAIKLLERPLKKIVTTVSNRSHRVRQGFNPTIFRKVCRSSQSDQNR